MNIRLSYQNIKIQDFDWKLATDLFERKLKL